MNKTEDYDNKTENKCRINSAYITVEASLVFPIVIIVTVLFILYAMKIHDQTIGQILSMYTEDYERQAQWSYYNPSKGKIDKVALTGKPLVGYDDDFYTRICEEISVGVTDYYLRRKLMEEVKIKPEITHKLKPGTVVRLSAAVLRAAERINEK